MVWLIYNIRIYVHNSNEVTTWIFLNHIWTALIHTLQVYSYVQLPLLKGSIEDIRWEGCVGGGNSSFLCRSICELLSLHDLLNGVAPSPPEVSFVGHRGVEDLYWPIIISLPVREGEQPQCHKWKYSASHCHPLTSVKGNIQSRAPWGGWARIQQSKWAPNSANLVSYTLNWSGNKSQPMQSLKQFKGAEPLSPNNHASRAFCTNLQTGTVFLD